MSICPHIMLKVNCVVILIKLINRISIFKINTHALKCVLCYCYKTTWPGLPPAAGGCPMQPGSQPTMFMTGPRSLHQRRRAQAARDLYECMTLHSTDSRIESPSVPVQGMHMKVFSKVHCDRVYFLCAERFETGSGFRPPAAPPVHMKVGGGGGGTAKVVNVDTREIANHFFFILH